MDIDSSAQSFGALHGYLVVEVIPTEAYRGPDRGPYWSADQEIDHWSLLGELNSHLDGDNLAETLAGARAAMEIYQRALRKELEIVYVQAEACGSEPLATERTKLLGVDICTPAPYASLLSGHCSWAERENVQTNEAGLLDSVERARAIIERRVGEGSIGAEDMFLPWFVFALDPD